MNCIQLLKFLSAFFRLINDVTHWRFVMVCFLILVGLLGTVLVLLPPEVAQVLTMI